MRIAAPTRSQHRINEVERMGTLTMAVAVLASVTLVAEAGAQTQVPTPTGQNSPPLGEQTPAQEGEEKTVEGQVGSSSRTEITLTDGTKLVTPPGVVIRPGVLTEGVIVIAS